MTLKITRTNSDNTDFRTLVAHLDKYLTVIDGDEHSFYDQFNKIDKLNHVIICHQDEKALGGGAIKEFDKNSMEIKRMYVLPESRGQGVAKRVLTELENWAKELGYTRCVLETGKRMPDAIGLYEKSGYKRTPNYGQYVGMDNSVCFEKLLID